MKTLTDDECEEKIKHLLANQTTSLTIKDSDDIQWNNGFADYLLANYFFDILTTGFESFLNKPNNNLTESQNAYNQKRIQLLLKFKHK